MAFFSCKNCTERYVGCHSTCEKYIKESAENERQREARRTQTISLNSNGTMYKGTSHRKKPEY